MLPSPSSKGSNPIIIGKSLPDAELDNIIALGNDVRVRSITVGSDGKAKSGEIIVLTQQNLHSQAAKA